MTSLLPYDDALRILLDAAVPLPPVEVALEESVGRVLAEEIEADRDFPPTDRSAMDGFAVRAADLREPGGILRVAGEVRAGASARGVVVRAGEAVRVFTGAEIPEGADAVVMVELTREDRAAGTVTIGERPEAGQHVRRRGEETRAGSPVLWAGAPIGPAEIAALASVGRARVRVHRPPTAAILSTGDEIVPVSAVPAPHQVRNSNAEALRAALRRMGIPCRLLGPVEDREEALDAAIAEGLRADVLLVTGGVSVGAYDLVRAGLERARVEVLFHGVAMRPGKPALGGRHAGGLVAGLPGNPVSAFTVFELLVAPALRRLEGRSRAEGAWVPVVLGEPSRRKPGRRTFALARVLAEEGRLVARPTATRGSGDVLSLSGANAFLDVPEGAHALPAGTPLRALLWEGWPRETR